MREVYRESGDFVSSVTGDPGRGFCAFGRLCRVIKGWFCMENLPFKFLYVFIPQVLLLAFFVILFSVLFEAVSKSIQAAESPGGSNCSECHIETVNTVLSKIVIHPPFLQERCTFCHIEDSKANKEEADIISMENINWLDSDFSPARKHWFNIPADYISSRKLIVIACAGMGKFHEKVFALPPIETLQEKLVESTPYVLTPEVIGVYRGVLVSGQIGWSTREDSDSEVRYGIDRLRYSEKSDKFTTDHEILLQNLKPNQKYQYKTISKDILGNTAESEIQYFSTNNFSPQTPNQYESPAEIRIQLNAQFFRNKNSYLVSIAANYPVKLRIGSEIVNEEGNKVAEKSIPNDQNHLSMRSGNDLEASVCIKCHPGRLHILEHQVNKDQPSGTTIPAEYSTGRDGSITCVTCHANHASNYQYRTIKEASRELCVGCHKGYSPQVSEESLDPNLAP